MEESQRRIPKSASSANYIRINRARSLALDAEKERRAESPPAKRTRPLSIVEKRISRIRKPSSSAYKIRRVKSCENFAEMFQLKDTEKLTSTPLIDGLLPDQFYQQELSVLSTYNSEADLSNVSLDIEAQTTGHKYWNHIIHKSLFRRSTWDNLGNSPTATDVDSVVSSVI